MKTKLRTFAHKQILRGKHNVKPVGLMKTHHNYIFIQILWYIFCLQNYSN